MIKRAYGKNNEMISVIGFGGIIVTNETQDDANDHVAEAIDLGVNYFDVAPTYGDAEDRLGPALTGKRDKVFLACKTAKRDFDGAVMEMNASMEKLNTDFFDLYQLHGVASMDDVDKILGPGGCISLLDQAKKDGRIRYAGFSAHSQEAAIALMDAYDFDSVLFPYNWMNVNVNGFGEAILKKAVEKGVTRLALKAIAHKPWDEGEEHVYKKSWYRPVEDEQMIDLALRFTLSAPITAAIPPGYIEYLRLAVKTAQSFKPLTEEERLILKEKSSGIKPLFTA